MPRLRRLKTQPAGLDVRLERFQRLLDAAQLFKSRVQVPLDLLQLRGQRLDLLAVFFGVELHQIVLDDRQVRLTLAGRPQLILGSGQQLLALGLSLHPTRPLEELGTAAGPSFGEERHAAQPQQLHASPGLPSFPAMLPQLSMRSPRLLGHAAQRLQFAAPGRQRLERRDLLVRIFAGLASGVPHPLFKRIELPLQLVGFVGRGLRVSQVLAGVGDAMPGLQGLGDLHCFRQAVFLHRKAPALSFGTERPLDRLEARTQFGHAFATHLNRPPSTIAGMQVGQAIGRVFDVPFVLCFGGKCRCARIADSSARWRLDRRSIFRGAFSYRGCWWNWDSRWHHGIHPGDGHRCLADLGGDLVALFDAFGVANRLRVVMAFEAPGEAQAGAADERQAESGDDVDGGRRLIGADQRDQQAASSQQHQKLRDPGRHLGSVRRRMFGQRALPGIEIRGPLSQPL